MLIMSGTELLMLVLDPSSCCYHFDRSIDIIVLPWIRNTSGYFKLDSAFIATP